MLGSYQNRYTYWLSTVVGIWRRNRRQKSFRDLPGFHWNYRLGKSCGCQEGLTPGSRLCHCSESQNWHFLPSIHSLCPNYYVSGDFTINSWWLRCWLVYSKTPGLQSIELHCYCYMCPWTPDRTSRDAAIAYDLYQILILDSTPLNIHTDENVMNGDIFGWCGGRKPTVSFRL